MRNVMRAALATALTAASLLVSGTAYAAPSVLIVGSEYYDSSLSSAELLATGLFSAVNTFNSYSDTPTLVQLQTYSAVLTYTNFPPANATALGDVLKDYVDGGGGLVINTYSFSDGFAVAGGIAGHGYSPLVDSGTTANVSGSLVPVAPSPIFTGVNLGALSYFHNDGFAVPTLDSGATLLATDGAGAGAKKMIAINASGRIIANNLFPGSGYGNDPNFYRLTANELVLVSSVPEPETYMMMMGGLLAIVVARRKRSS